MKFLAMLCVMFLVACSTVEKVPVSVPFETKVPVIVPCIEKEELPPVPLLASAQVKGSESDCELVNVVLTDRAQLKLYIEQIQPLLKGCVKP